MELNLREREIPAIEFGSMSLSSGGYPNYGAMLSGSEREDPAAVLRSRVIGMFVG